jgi:hypothetical protein
MRAGPPGAPVGRVGTGGAVGGIARQAVHAGVLLRAQVGGGAGAARCRHAGAVAGHVATVVAAESLLCAALARRAAFVERKPRRVDPRQATGQAGGSIGFLARGLRHLAADAALALCVGAGGLAAASGAIGPPIGSRSRSLRSLPMALSRC